MAHGDFYDSPASADLYIRRVALDGSASDAIPVHSVVLLPRLRQIYTTAPVGLPVGAVKTHNIVSVGRRLLSSHTVTACRTSLDQPTDPFAGVGRHVLGAAGGAALRFVP